MQELRDAAYRCNRAAGRLLGPAWPSNPGLNMMRMEINCLTAVGRKTPRQGEWFP